MYEHGDWDFNPRDGAGMHTGVKILWDYVASSPDKWGARTQITAAVSGKLHPNK